MLDLFIIKAGQKNSDIDATVDSFDGKINALFFVDNVDEINDVIKTSEWYGVLYDNESIQDKLLVSLHVFFEQTSADVLLAYRLDDENDKPHSVTPRFFRKKVKLKDNCLNAIDENLEYTTILNGWILNNVVT